MYREAGYIGGISPWRQDLLRNHYLVKLPGDEFDANTLRGIVRKFIDDEHFNNRANAGYNTQNLPTLEDIMVCAEQRQALFNINRGLTREGSTIGYGSYQQPRGYYQPRTKPRFLGTQCSVPVEPRSRSRGRYYNYNMEINNKYELAFIINFHSSYVTYFYWLYVCYHMFFRV
jgi:hypothetical protein